MIGGSAGPIYFIGMKIGLTRSGAAREHVLMPCNYNENRCKSII